MGQEGTRPDVCCDRRLGQTRDPERHASKNHRASRPISRGIQSTTRLSHRTSMHSPAFPLPSLGQGNTPAVPNLRLPTGSDRRATKGRSVACSSHPGCAMAIGATGPNPFQRPVQRVNGNVNPSPTIGIRAVEEEHPGLDHLQHSCFAQGAPPIPDNRLSRQRLEQAIGALHAASPQMCNTCGQEQMF